jgi:ferredoxin-NADP reductase
MQGSSAGATSMSATLSNRFDETMTQIEPTMRNDLVTTIVRNVHDVGEGVRAYELVQPEEWDLPRFTPGAHIDVHIPGGFVRPYSLLGDPALRRSYFIAVAATPAGTGGSAAMHNSVSRGDWLSISLPRNFFPLADAAKKHVFVAGGIGITPFLSMIAQLERSGEPFELHMCSPSKAETPFFEELSQIRGGGVFLHHSRGTGSRRLNVQRLIEDLEPDDHVYCCGPQRLMDAVRKSSHALGIAGRVHFERFDRPSDESGSRPYRLDLLRRKLAIEVLSGETMLSALKRHDINVDYGCEGGTCGRCRIGYASGAILHRDFVLSDVERRSTLISCVCGVTSESVALDL